MNPFYQYEERGKNEGADEFGFGGIDTSSHMFAYSSDLSGIFEHLNKHNRMKEQVAASERGTSNTLNILDTDGDLMINTSRGTGELDIIRE